MIVKKKMRKHGFLVRMRTANGRAVVNNRRNVKRKRI